MSKDRSYVNAQIEKFANLLEDAVREIKPDIEFRWRKMFGGAGYYAGDIMFAGMYDDHTIGLKLNDSDCEALLAIEGAEQGMGKNTINLPVAMLENKEALREWVSKSLDYAANRPAKKKKRK